MMKYHPTASQSYSYYFYETNLQGDVVAIYDANGSKVVSFSYDAWGNFTATVVNSTVCTDFFIEATLFRYRGYIYDYESGLYYLQSRYYDPETGRFINADKTEYLGVNQDILAYNLYVYCSNNPINCYDPHGAWTFTISLNFSIVIPLAGNGYSFSIGLSVDSEDNVAIQTSTSVPYSDNSQFIGFGGSASAGVGFQYTNLKNVEQLNGSATTIGTGAIGAVCNQSGDIVGVSTSVSPYSIGGDFHFNKTYTETHFKFKSLFKTIREWFE